MYALINSCEILSLDDLAIVFFYCIKEKTEEKEAEEEEIDQNYELKPRFIDCPEDTAFCEALDKMIAEALLSSTSGSNSSNVSGTVTSVTSTINVSTDTNPASSRTLSVNVLPTPEILQLAAAKSRLAMKEDGSSSTNKVNQQAINHHNSTLHSVPTKSNRDNLEINHSDTLSAVNGEDSQVRNILYISVLSPKIICLKYFVNNSPSCVANVIS